jgi:hypothetical protein
LRDADDGGGAGVGLAWAQFAAQRMNKSPRVTFSPKRIAEGDWQIEAHYPGAEIWFIDGLKSKEDAIEWVGENRKVDWLSRKVSRSKPWIFSSGSRMSASCRRKCGRRSKAPRSQFGRAKRNRRSA